jgi:hypothetical protein
MDSNNITVSANIPKKLKTLKTAGVLVIAFVSSKAALSSFVKMSLVCQFFTAAILSSVLPELLLPAALESIQKGHVTI